MQVIHVKEIVSGDVYVARATREFRGSVLGNPFRIGRDGTREEVIEKYRRWLKEEIKKEGLVYQELVKLVNLYRENPNIRLACWCKPQGCHGDVIVKAVIWLNEHI